MLRGTPKQWCDNNRAWIRKERDRLLQPLNEEANRCGGKLPGDSIVGELKTEHGEARSCLIEDYNNLLMQARRSRVSHASREANRGADWLDNYGRTTKEMCVWLNDFSANLLCILQRDAAGCMYWRC